MNFNFEGIEELKREAIAFRKNYPVKIKGEEGQGWSPDQEFLKKWQHCYAVNNGVLAYVEGDTVYVIPDMSNVKDVVKYTDDMEKFQKLNSTAENRFFVPLSNGERIENDVLQEHWEFLKAVRHEYLKR